MGPALRSAPPTTRPFGPSAHQTPRRPDAVGSPAWLLSVQRTAGNRAVSALVRARPPSPSAPTVQRCGPIPCDCSDAERAEYDRAQEPAAVPAVQRHQGVDTFRTKPKLESTELGSVPELQVAASSAATALEVGKSSGAAVSRLQEVLTAKGFPVAVTGTYDAATQGAVARFQSAHGIPFPTGRQSGPKTLSTLDDHLTGAKPSPVPKPECNQYLPGEREASLTAPGTTRRLGTFGDELEMLNFAAGQERLKPEHVVALKAFVSEFSLFDPCTEFTVGTILGFTDSVDRAELNAQLRLDRANTVAGFLQTNGVPEAPDGSSADPATYDNGCDPSTRSVARRVAVRLVKRPLPESCRDKPPPPEPRPKPRPSGGSFPGCDDALSKRLDAALPGAVDNLTKAMGLLSVRPLRPAARDALFTYFRVDDDVAAALVTARLGLAARGLNAQPTIDCNALIGCGSGTHAVTNLVTGTIHICNGGTLDPDQPNLERTLMHEAMHAFAGFSALGEKSHGDAPDCDEADMGGASVSTRMTNADTHAAIAVRLAKTSPDSIHRSAEHFRGGDLRLTTAPKNTTTVALGAGPETFTATLEGFQDLAPRLHWRLSDAAGRLYPLRTVGGEVIAPDGESDSVAVRVDRETRDLLAARGVDAGAIDVRTTNNLGVDRVSSLALTFTR